MTLKIELEQLTLWQIGIDVNNEGAVTNRLAVEKRVPSRTSSLSTCQELDCCRE